MRSQRGGVQRALLEPNWLCSRGLSVSRATRLGDRLPPNRSCSSPAVAAARAALSVARGAAAARRQAAAGRLRTPPERGARAGGASAPIAALSETGAGEGGADMLWGMLTGANGAPRSRR